MDDPILASASFLVTPADIAASYRAALRWRYTRMPSSLVLPCIYGFAGALGAMTNGGPRPPAWVIVLAFFAGAFVAIVLRVLLYAAAPLIARRTMRIQKNLRHEWRVELTRRGMRAITPAQNLFTAWSEYVAWSEDRHVILVYQSDRLYQYMPVRAASPEMLATFHELIACLPRR